jgi:protocatechuate 3,4-dioxygenase beta subunit
VAIETPEVCAPTDPDIPGPFYRPGVPIRSDLDLYGDAGVRLTLSGLVLGLDCNPIPDAVVEIWHADPTTVPVEELTAADSVDYDHTSAEMRYRGQIATDADGRYTFHTKKPGWYRVGSTFRPMHLHVKVWVGDRERLTTQLYFHGDPYIEGDPWASLDRAVTAVAAGEGRETATFNFTVDPDALVTE